MMRPRFILAVLAILHAHTASAQQIPKDRKDAAYNAGQAAGMLQWAVENCGGKIAPTTEAALQLGHALDDDVFFASGVTAYAQMMATAKDVGVPIQCGAFTAGYGPDGSIVKGAYIPPKQKLKGPP